jgi:leucyl/phenylalanyl-tRNA--protein transferase
MVLRPADFHLSRSLARLDRQGRYRLTMDTAFARVIARCARQKRAQQWGTWINGGMVDCYVQLHERGIAHSVEVWDASGGLVGGLYGLALGHVFFGESMFAAQPNTSKLALLRLCRHLERCSFHFLDCQQDTQHLRSLGARPISRAVFMEWLGAGLAAGDAWVAPSTPPGSAS